MKREIYNAVYRLFKEADYLLTINVGPVELKLYDPEKEHTYVWDMGIVANGTPYTVGDLYCEGLGPGTYADMFTGEYDIIDGLATQICNDI